MFDRGDTSAEPAFHDKLQFETAGSSNFSPYLWGNGLKREHRRWIGLKRRRVQEEDNKKVNTDAGAIGM
jgi:hypothetical protein